MIPGWLAPSFTEAPDGPVTGSRLTNDPPPGAIWGYFFLQYVRT